MELATSKSTDSLIYLRGQVRQLVMFWGGKEQRLLADLSKP
jgi:hypothetical protein